MTTLLPQSPPARKPVLFDDAVVVAATLRATPGEWFLIAGDEKAKLGVISQTAFRIKHGVVLKAFVAPEGGHFETRVSGSNPEAKYPVELYARFVPTKKRKPAK
jgi:hypothetical protein